jgi:hypothetical protein
MGAVVVKQQIGEQFLGLARVKTRDDPPIMPNLKSPEKANA